MNRKLTTSVMLLLALALALTAAFSLPGTARAGGVHGPKVEERLAALADSKGQEDQLDVIVLGSDAKGKGRKLGQLKKGLDLVGGAAVSVKVKHLDKLASEDGVSFVALDAPIAPQAVDYSRLTTTYPYTVKAPRSWDLNFEGQGVGIAVIDSGVQPVSDFSGRLVQVALPFQTWAQDDVHGHGTMVAGIAAGRSADGKFIGVAPASTVYALNVNRPEGPRSSDVIDALQWVHENAHRNNIRVVNLSLSETVPSSYKTSPLDLAVERVWAAGIAVVVSAGNGGSLPGSTDYAPANDPLAITVGSIDDKLTKSSADDVVAGFTASGTTIDGYPKPEISSPGRLIASTLPAGTYLDSTAPSANKIAPGYATISGTSFSAPQVAAAAAILFGKNPALSPDNVKWLLNQTSKAVGTARTLALGDAVSFTGTVGRANQGVPALVCAPGTTCLTGTTVASIWDSATWNANTWSSATWNSATWNSATWNSATWNANTWSSATWNSATWNSATWNAFTWNSYSWN